MPVMLIPPKVRTALESILEYNWADEEADYSRAGELNPEDPDGFRHVHIYRQLQVVRKWMNDIPQGGLT